MWRRENSFSVVGTWGDVGGSGNRGTSAALLMARKDSSSEAVTREAEVHRGRRRMLDVVEDIIQEAWVVVAQESGDGSAP